MKSPNELITGVAALLQERLEGVGFTKRRQGIFSIDISDDVIGWLGLNRAVEGRADLEINPVVGVRNQRIERIVAELTQRPFDKLVPPTLAGHLGYLTPEKRYVPVRFAPGESQEPSAVRLIESLQAYGFPFMKGLADPVTLLDALLKSEFAVREFAAYRIAAGLFFIGRNAESINFLDARLAEIADRGDPAADQFRRFSVALRQKIGA